ncbi:MAG: hypothetical protein LBK46_06595 [Oscillospiraceae bacterium]|jgi:hypothetical protein|nr:hypothetical protein [Oscillospiraceae bacterium]
MHRMLGRLWRGLLLLLIMIVFGVLLYLSIILTDSPERRASPTHTGAAAEVEVVIWI